MEFESSPQPGTIRVQGEANRQRTAGNGGQSNPLLTWVGQQPLLAFGTAIVVGYTLGNLGSGERRFQQPGTFSTLVDSAYGWPRLKTNDFAHRFESIQF